MQLNILAFGVSSSSFLVIRVIQRLADDERHIYLRVAEIIKEHLYMDDLLTKATTIEVRKIRNEIIANVLYDLHNVWESHSHRK